MDDDDDNNKEICSFLCHISTLESRLRSQREWVVTVQPRSTSRHVQQLVQKNETLEHRLTASQNSLEKILAENQIWQNTCKTLQDKFNDKMAEKERAAQDLLTELVSEKQDWQEKCKALQAQFSKEMAEKEQAAQIYLMKLILENQDCQEQCQGLQQKFNKELVEKEHSWETRTTQLVEENKELAEKEQRLETKVKQLEAENKELAEKLEKMDCASHKVTETTDQLCPNQVESLQGDKTQDTEPKDVPEESREELVELTKDDQTLDSELTQMEEEKNSLQEPCAEMKDKKKTTHFWSGKKSSKTEQTQVETSKNDETEIKMKKQEQKVEKNKKKWNFLGWILRKKDTKSDSDSNVEEEAAGCSSDIQLQLQ